MSKSSEQLTELELRIATLIRRYGEQRASLAQKKEECEQLLLRNSEQERRIHHLEQNLSIAAVSGRDDSQEARKALEGLGNELSEIMAVIDECITLLESRIE